MPYAYLLRTPSIYHLLGVLSLLSVLPRQINNKIARLFVLAHIRGVHFVFPATAWRFPLDSLCARRWGGVERVAAVALSGSLSGCLGGGGGCALAFPLRERLLCLLKYLVPAANALKIFMQYLGCVFSETEKRRKGCVSGSGHE